MWADRAAAAAAAATNDLGAGTHQQLITISNQKKKENGENPKNRGKNLSRERLCQQQQQQQRMLPDKKKIGKSLGVGALGKGEKVESKFSSWFKLPPFLSYEKSEQNLKIPLFKKGGNKKKKSGSEKFQER